MNNVFLELLEKNGKVSLMDDIIPVVMNEFCDIPASGNTNQMVMDFVRQNITAAIISMDKKVIAIPVIVCVTHKGTVIQWLILFMKLWLCSGVSVYVAVNVAVKM